MRHVKRLRKNSKQVLNAVKAADKGMSFSEEDYHQGREVSGDVVRDFFNKWYDDIRVRQVDNSIVLFFHSNHWMEIPA